MSSSTSIRLAVALAVALTAFSPSSVAVAGEPQDAGEQTGERKAAYCFVHLDAPGDVRCFSTEARRTEAEAEFLKATAESAVDEVAAASSSSYIATHWAGTSTSGTNINILGTTCGGGVWRPTGFWDNEIGYTTHRCGSAPIHHFDASSCEGTAATLWQSGTLGSMNDRTSCVRYG